MLSFVGYVYINVILYATISLSQQNCVRFDVSLTQIIENQGFHRNILWLLELDTNVPKTASCTFCIHLRVPNSMYVNPDEVADLIRVNELLAYVEGAVDVEKPAHESKPHEVFVYATNKTRDVVNLSLPIHLRYHRAQITGGYNRAVLPKPSILASCENVDVCDKSNVIRGRCNAFTNEVCSWRNVTYKGVSEVDLLVPIGDLDDFAFVSVITLFLGCAGCIYILSVLSSANL